MLSSSCDIAQFGIPGYPAMGEKMVVGTNGAAAVWSAIGGVYNRDSVLLSGGVFESLFTSGTSRIGDAVMDSFESAPHGASLSDHYVLLGDPALALGSADELPRAASVPDEMSFDEWQRLTFAPVNMDRAGAEGDANGDGVINRMAYLLGTDAVGSGSDGGFGIWASRRRDDGDLVEVSFWKRRGVNVSQRVSGCSDLQRGDWSDISVSGVRIGRIDGTMEEVILLLNPVHTAKRSVFFKVIVGE